MAPTVCMPDFPAKEKTESYSRRRHKSQDGSIKKRQRSALKNFTGTTPENLELSLSHLSSPIPQQKCPMDPSVPIASRFPNNHSTRITFMQSNRWKIDLKQNGLLDIFARTLALLKRNHILQQRVNALRDETQSFISSVMKNPINEEKQTEDFLSRDRQLVSSSSEISSKSPFPPSFECRSDSELNQVSSSSEVISQESTKR